MIPVPDSYASGWYRFAFSHELGIGEVKPFRFFGNDLVAFRGDDGAPHLLDAHCQHLGAHLGHGGVVEGACLRCPYHGWVWDGAGRNVEIPEEEGTSRRTVGHWTTLEHWGLLYFWYDPDSREPTWWPGPIVEPGQEAAYHEVTPMETRSWSDVDVYPQCMVENVVDPGHFRYVHGSQEIPTVLDHEATGPQFRTTLSYSWGAGYESTWLTPDGPIPSTVYTESWGMGIVLTRYFGIPEMVQVSGVTPIDGRRAEVCSVIVVKKAAADDDRLNDIQARLVKHLLNQPDNDIPVWSNMAMLPRPAFRRQEGKLYAAVRSWADQFYKPAPPPNAWLRISARSDDDDELSELRTGSPARS